MNSSVETFLYLAPIIVASLVLHELAHALVATRFGDPTPREQGRLTLNPIPHLDPLGTAMFGITYFTTGFLFGWARPVIVDTRYLRRPKQQMAVIAAAGPATNFVLAIVLAAVIIHGGITPFSEVDTVLEYAYFVNIVLGIFNLLPIPPLDGSRIVAAAMNEAAYVRWSQLDQYGMIAIFALLFVFNRQWSTFLNSALERTSDVIVRLVGG